MVSHATHSTLAAYAGTHLWQKIGAEQEAAWAADPTANDVAYCCYVAALRDWLRLGLMLAHDGIWNGQQIVPRQYLLDGTTVSKGDDYLRRAGAGYGRCGSWPAAGERSRWPAASGNGCSSIRRPAEGQNPIKQCESTSAFRQIPDIGDVEQFGRK